MAYFPGATGLFPPKSGQIGSRQAAPANRVTFERASQSCHAAYKLGQRALRYRVEVGASKLNAHVSQSGFPALVLNADFRPLSFTTVAVVLAGRIKASFLSG